MGAANVFVTSVFLTSLVFIPTTRGQTVQDHYYNLIDTLFADYKAEVRPTNDDTTTIINVNLWLLSIQNLDEKNQVLSTAVIIESSWVDPWLQWDPSTYGDIQLFRYPQKKLWLPDIVVINSVQSQYQLGYDENPMLVKKDGTVEWYPSEVIQTSCDIDVTYYPFDTQVCRIVVSTWVSTSEQVNLDIAENATDIDLSRFSPSGSWELSDTLLIPTADDAMGFTRLQYSFKLRRLSTFYVMNMIIPVLFLSLTASAVFYLPSEAGEKIGMSMTVLLSYAVYLTIISENMPQTSLQISILSVYLTMLLGITAVSVVLSVLILHWHHTPDDVKVGRRMTIITRTIRRAFCLSPKTNDDNAGLVTRLDLLGKRRDSFTLTSAATKSKSGKISPGEVQSIKVAPQRQEEEEEEKMTWVLVGDTFDNVFFVSISLIIVLLTVIIFIILVVGGARQNAREM